MQYLTQKTRYSGSLNCGWCTAVGGPEVPGSLGSGTKILISVR